MLGRIKFEDAPSYVNKFDVAIIPHKLNSLVQTMNPMKMYDYLACGKPVVATGGAGLSMFKEYIHIANDSEKFIEAIDHELKSDSKEKQNNRRSAVRPHSWKARADKMTKLIFDKLA